nr:PRD domain-containing protein [Collinsella aerofaciens]
MVTSDDGSELIVIGRGLCFGRHAGDAIDEASIEKTYALQEGTSQDSRTIDRLAHLLESIPTVNLVISEDIVQMLRRELNVDINDKILIALADHISLALERERKGVSCENPLLLEIQQFYRKEYALAGRALQIIKEYMGIQMSEEDQGFITLHIVNATMPQRSDRLIVSVQLVRDVLAIVSERMLRPSTTPRCLTNVSFVTCSFSHSEHSILRQGKSTETRCSESMKRRIRAHSRARTP